jgi:hypothetical protein
MDTVMIQYTFFFRKFEFTCSVYEEKGYSKDRIS